MVFKHWVQVSLETVKLLIEPPTYANSSDIVAILKLWRGRLVYSAMYKKKTLSVGDRMYSVLTCKSSKYYTSDYSINLTIC